MIADHSIESITSPRRILMCVTGMSPQIVTETLYALTVPKPDGDPAWIPDEIHLISTTVGIHQAKLNLLSSVPGWFARLCKDYSLPSIRFDDDCLHAISDRAGKPMEDIRSPEDNEAAADYIAECLRHFTANPNTELHVSLAGGRKTMGYYLGYALSLYGRPQDRLSHVLISSPYEGHPEFYYPTPSECIIQVRGEKGPQASDCAAAKVSLAMIPFVHLRDGLPQRLLEGKSSFTEAVDLANHAQGPAHLLIDLQRQKAWVNDLHLPLNEAQFALLYWFAERKNGGNPEVHLEDKWPEYRQILERFWPSNLVFQERPQSVQKAITAIDSQTSDYYAYFKTPISRINKLFRYVLGESLAEKVKIAKPKRGKKTGFLLPKDLRILIQEK